MTDTESLKWDGQCPHLRHALAILSNASAASGLNAADFMWAQPIWSGPGADEFDVPLMARLSSAVENGVHSLAGSDTTSSSMVRSGSRWAAAWKVWSKASHSCSLDEHGVPWNTMASVAGSCLGLIQLRRSQTQFLATWSSTCCLKNSIFAFLTVLLNSRRLSSVRYSLYVWMAALQSAFHQWLEHAKTCTVLALVLKAPLTIIKKTSRASSMSGRVLSWHRPTLMSVSVTARENLAASSDCEEMILLMTSRMSS